MAVTHAIGRRKTSVARVYVQEGKGNIVINNKALSDYFPSAIMQFKVEQPFSILEEKGNFDVKVNIKNYGTDTITTATVNWKFDGVVQTPYSFSA